MKSRVNIYSRPLPEIDSYYMMVDFAAEYGLNVETINSHELRKPDIEFAKRLREYACQKGVEFPCVSLGINLVGDDAREEIERTKKYADVAAILGAPYLHHTIAMYLMDREELDKNRELYIERGISAVKEIYDYAQTLGVKTIYEDQGYIFNGIEGVKLIEKAGRDTGILADFGNIQFVDENIEEFIPAVAEKIVHVHVKDYIVHPERTYIESESFSKSLRNSGVQRCYLGEGSVDFDSAFAELKKAGYTGSVSIESSYNTNNARKMFEKDLEFLKKYVD